MYRDNSNENTRKVRCDEVDDEKCQHVERSAHEPSHRSAIENQEPEIRSVVAQGDVVVIVAHEHGRLRDSRRPYTLHWVQMFTFRDGRVARFRLICNSAAMVDARLRGEFGSVTLLSCHIPAGMMIRNAPHLWHGPPNSR
jgi:hypothetical protein